MPITININGLSLCHKGSEGWVHNTLPDVCKTPSKGKPIPYENEAYSRDLVKGTTTVFADGGNMIAMQQICDELGGQVDAVLVGTTYVTEAGPDLAQYCEDQPGVMHGGEAETSMMLACEPDLVDTSNLASMIDGMDGGSFLKAGTASYRWRPFPHITGNGMAGNASRASAEKGEKMLEAGANALAALILDPETWADPRDRRGPGTMGVPFT